MSLQEQLKQLEREERYEEAQALRDQHCPSKSIWEAIIRWIDCKRMRAEAPKSEPVRHCDNCAYRSGGSFAGYGFCQLSGHYCSTERSMGNRCGKNFENWKPRS